MCLGRESCWLTPNLYNVGSFVLLNYDLLAYFGKWLRDRLLSEWNGTLSLELRL